MDRSFYAKVEIPDFAANILKDSDMVKIVSVILALLMLSACTSTERGAAAGAVAGGAVGAAVDGTGGAIVGAAGGAVAGALIGRAYDNRCRYSDGRGGTYIARC